MENTKDTEQSRAEQRNKEKTERAKPIFDSRSVFVMAWKMRKRHHNALYPQRNKAVMRKKTSLMPRRTARETEAAGLHAR